MLYILKSDQEKLERALKVSNEIRLCLLQYEIAKKEEFGLDDIIEALILTATMKNVRLIDSKKTKPD